ncbi:hypothetical protein, partial [Helicobacter kayseriensis]|uniref:hypothetical protein n=1 Tax=Helicobacter kayseriensis TaxID=2905877 RepID=UPI001E539351
MGVSKQDQNNLSKEFISQDGFTYEGGANGQPDGSKFGTIISTTNNSYGIVFNLENSKAKMKGDLVFKEYKETEYKGDIYGIRINSKGNTLSRNSQSQQLIKIQFQGLAPSSGNPNAKSYIINNNGGEFTLGEGIFIVTAEAPNLNNLVATLTNFSPSKEEGSGKENPRKKNNYLFENGSSTTFSGITDTTKAVAGIATTGASVYTNFDITSGSQVTFKEINASSKEAFGIYSDSEGNFNLKLNEGSTLTFEKIIGESNALGILQNNDAWNSKHILKDSTLHFKHIEARKSNVEGLLNRGQYTLYELSNSTIQFDLLKSGEEGKATGLVGGSKDGTFYKLSNNSRIVFDKIEGNRKESSGYTSAVGMYFNENTNFNLDSSSYILFKEITSNGWMSIISVENQANVMFNGGKILFDQITSTSKTSSIELVSLKTGTITLGNDAQILFGKTSIENDQNTDGNVRGIVYSGTISGNGSIIFTDRVTYTSLAHDGTNYTQNFFNGAKIYADSVSLTLLRAGSNATLNVNLNNSFYGGTLENGAKLAITGDSSGWRNLNLTMGNGAKLVLNSRDTKNSQVDLGVIDNLKGI